MRSAYIDAVRACLHKSSNSTSWLAAHMSDSDNENYVFYGTPLQEEVESHAGQHHKAVQDPSLTRSLPVWQQVSC